MNKRTGHFIYNEGGVIPSHIENRIEHNKFMDGKLIGFERSTKIQSFIREYRYMESIDLSSLVNVTSVGGGFLTKCDTLKSIDLSSLKNIARVGNDFLSNCTRLNEIDLSPLSNVVLVMIFFFFFFIRFISSL